MKLLRLGELGHERPAVLTAERTVDLTSEVSDYDSAFFAGGGVQRLRELAAGGFAGLPDAAPGQRGGAPVGPNDDVHIPRGSTKTDGEVELGDLSNIALELDLNGVAQQRGTTADMVNGVLELVRYLSGFTVLHPGCARPASVRSDSVSFPLPSHGIRHRRRIPDGLDLERSHGARHGRRERHRPPRRAADA